MRVQVHPFAPDPGGTAQPGHTRTRSRHDVPDTGCFFPSNYNVDAGLLTREEIGQHLADLAAGALDLAAFPVVSAWGRKPRR
jgi:hypothetical protein